MGLAEALHPKPLGSLGPPELAAIRGATDCAAGIHLLDRVGDPGGGNHGLPGPHRRPTAGDQLRSHQAAGAVVDQHVLGPCRQGLQAPAYGLLAGVPPLNPNHRPIRLGGVHEGPDRRPIHGLSDQTNPSNLWAGQGGVQGPGQHRPARQGQQQLVPRGSHAPATAGGGNQQMHKRSVSRGHEQR